MSSPFGHHRTAEVSVRGKNWSDHGGGSSSFQGGSSSHAPGSPRIIPIVRSPVSHLRSLSFPDGPPPKPRRASMSLSRGTVKSVISTASQQDTPSLDSGPYCTIEKGTGHKQPNEQDYDSDDETYEYSLYEPPPNAKKTSTPRPAMPQVPPPSAAKVDQQQIRNSKLFAPEFPFDEKWRNFAKDDRPRGRNAWTSACLIIFVVAFILVFAVFFTFWWSQYYFENKSQGLGLLAAFSGYRNQQIFTSTTTKAVNKAKEGLTSSLQTTAELVTVEGTTPVANPNDRLFLFSGVDVEGEQSTTTTPKKQQQQQNRMSDVDPSDNDAPPSIEVSQLYDLLEHGRQVRVFEVFGSEREETSRRGNRNETIPTRRPLYINGLTHNGVPVHPLQFQRNIRSHGVDQDTIVVVYDQHPQNVLAFYAFWLFKLYGLNKVSIMFGGVEPWNNFVRDQQLEQNVEAYKNGKTAQPHQGNFKAKWVPKIIVTFDDAIANFGARDSNSFDIVDAQTTEEFNGNSSVDNTLVFGHIRGAVNIPIEDLLQNSSAENGAIWRPLDEQEQIFRGKRLNPRRPVIVYDGTSLRSAVVWFFLRRLNYQAGIYFGSWPEWLIKAPDHLKVIPETHHRKSAK